MHLDLLRWPRSLTALAPIARPLVFATLQPELAEAKGVPLRFVSVAFLAIVALAVAECASIVGDISGFHPDGRPGGGGHQPLPAPSVAVALSAVLALARSLVGLMLAFDTDWPTSFWITALSGMVFFGGVAARRFAG